MDGPGSTPDGGADLTASRKVTRLDDRWVLPVAGQVVTQLRIDNAVSLLLSDGWLVRIEQRFVVADGSGAEWVVVPGGDPAELGPVLVLSRSAVESGVAFDDGRLEIDLSDGLRISVAAGENYEAWEIAGPDGLQLVSLPDGGLSVWGSQE